jgi:hypothetical protein
MAITSLAYFGRVPLLEIAIGVLVLMIVGAVVLLARRAKASK